MSSEEKRKRKMPNELTKLTNGQKGKPSTFQTRVLDMPPNSKRTRKSVTVEPPIISQQLSNSGINGAIELDNMKKSSILASETTTETTNETSHPNFLNILVDAALTRESIPVNTTFVSIPVSSLHPGLTSTISSSSGSTPIVISKVVSRNITTEQNGVNSSDTDTNRSEIQNITVSSAATLRTSSASAIESPKYDLKSLSKIVKTNNETILKLKIRNIMLRMNIVQLKINNLNHERKKKWDDYLNNFKNSSQEGFEEKQKKLKNDVISLFKNIAEGKLEKEYLNLHTEMVKILTYFNFK